MDSPAQGGSFLKRNKILAVFCWVVVGFLMGLTIHSIFSEHGLSYGGKLVRENNPNYKFTNPILECEFGPKEGQSRFSASWGHLEKEILDLKKNYNLSEASVYFRDLNNGPWFGVNEDADFAPASLLKVPILIAHLAKADGEPNYLESTIKIDRDLVGDTLPPNILPSESAQIGKEYKIKELLALMITQSDNVAANVLSRIISVAEIENVFKYIGVPIKTVGEDANLSVRDYASFFRVLFNSSYLDRDNSEIALGLLSKTAFNNGLVAGVGGDVMVAHKFGERKNPNDVYSPVQLHDCGIVYYPENPYLLCIMTRGKDVNDLEKFIQEVSALFYREMKAQFPIAPEE